MPALLLVASVVLLQGVPCLNQHLAAAESFGESLVVQPGAVGAFSRLELLCRSLPRPLHGSLAGEAGAVGQHPSLGSKMHIQKRY